MSLNLGRLIEVFLAARQVRIKPGSYDWYPHYLQSLREALGETAADSTTCDDVYRWLARYRDKSPSTQHDAARAVAHLFNWAVETRHLDANPIAGFKKPPASRREAIVTPRDYAACVKASQGGFRQLIKFLWHTGARPQELRAIEARHLHDRRIIFGLAESKGRRRRRVIYLNDMAHGIVYHKANRRPTGPVFRNARGNPWTRQGLVSAFGRLRAKVGVPGLCAYALRHAWITRKLEEGLDVATVAELAGNSPQMVLDVYNHVARDHDRLISIV